MKKICLPFVFLAFITAGYSQSTHYWTEAYGNRSMLLNGVVVGSVQDLGAVYYNPARLAQFKTPAFVITGQVYELNKTTLKNGLGDGIDLEKSSFGGGPSLVSGTFELPFLKNSQFAYAFLTRSRVDNRFSYEVEDYGDFIEDYPGDEYFSGQINSVNSVKDEWMGLSWAHPINDKFSIGLTGFYSNLVRNASLRIQLQGYDTTLVKTGIYVDTRAYSFNSHSLLGKLGLSYKTERFTAGITITSSKLEVISDGSTVYERFLSGIDTTGNDQDNDIYVINKQGDLPSTTKSPWSVALGAGIRVGKRSLIHTSVEWFAPIPEYTILQSQVFTGQSTGVEYRMAVVDKLDAVLNYGLGWEVYVNENLSLFGSFATDYSAFKDEAKPISDLGFTVTNSSLRADIYHFGFGTDIKTKFANLTLGAMYANSREAVERNFTIDDGNDAVTSDIEVITSQWRFLIGFEFKFTDELKKKIDIK